MQVNPISNSQYSTSFNGGMHVNSKKAQWLITKSCSPKQIEKINDIFDKQKNNILYCFIYTLGDHKRLEAILQCEKFITNFKNRYKQAPLFESKFGFIKRLSRRMDKYQKQLQDAAKMYAKIQNSL